MALAVGTFAIGVRWWYAVLPIRILILLQTVVDGCYGRCCDHFHCLSLINLHTPDVLNFSTIILSASMYHLQSVCVRSGANHQPTANMDRSSSTFGRLQPSICKSGLIITFLVFYEISRKNNNVKLGYHYPAALFSDCQTAIFGAANLPPPGYTAVIVLESLSRHQLPPGESLGLARLVAPSRWGTCVYLLFGDAVLYQSIDRQVQHGSITSQTSTEALPARTSPFIATLFRTDSGKGTV